MEQPKSLDEYYNQLSSIYDPQRSLVNQQMAQLPQYFEGQKSALEQAKANAFRDIMNLSSARGAGWSGFRPGEEATYTGEKYLPALANLSYQQNQQQTALQQALNEINSQQGLTARGYHEDATQAFQQRQWQQEQDRIAREWQAQQAALDRQHAASMAAASAFSPSIGWGGNVSPASPATQKGPRIAQEKGGFYFYDGANKPINAVQYSGMTGTPLKTLLTRMANDGDANAKIALTLLNKRIINEKGHGTNLPGQFKGPLSALGITGDKWNLGVTTSPYSSPAGGGFLNTLGDLINFAATGGKEWYR